MKKPGWKEGTLSDIISDFESGVSVVGEDTPANPEQEYGVLRVSAVS
jgi:hypothetical protein